MTVTPLGDPKTDFGAIRQIEAAVGASDFERAFRLADAEITMGRSHPALYNARAIYFERQKEDHRALLDFQRALLLTPLNAVLLNAVGLCLYRLFRFEDAVDMFDRAIRCNPAYAPTHVRKGDALRLTGKTGDARAAYSRAIKLDPRNAEAHASLAAMAGVEGETVQARKHAAQALAALPRQPTALAALALADVADGNFAAAEECARSILADGRVEGAARAAALGILGDALDGQDRTPEAFAAYTAENLELLRISAIRFAGKTRVAELATSLAGFLDASPDAAWQGPPAPPAPGAAPSQHVFLLGFYRSGTTLLEQCLAAHPEIVTLEEQDFLEETAERYLTNPAALRELLTLAGPQLENARDDYWRRVHAAVPGIAGKTFIDKHPLNTLKLPLIARLFPDAKIILALRDPRDVVLSCFRRHFQINAAMYEMLTLHGTAESYDAVMNLALIARSRIPLDLVEHKYENLVGGFDAELQRICTFLGVSFDPRMADFASGTRWREITSPSRFQVRRPIYTESVGQWRRYADQLAPVVPLLHRWIEQFGYPAE